MPHSDAKRRETGVGVGHIRNRRRNIDIIRLNLEGEDPKSLARRYSISVWAIYKICRSAATARPLPDPKTGTRSGGSSRIF